MICGYARIAQDHLSRGFHHSVSVTVWIHVTVLVVSLRAVELSFGFQSDMLPDPTSTVDFDISLTQSLLTLEPFLSPSSVSMPFFPSYGLLEWRIQAEMSSDQNHLEWRVELQPLFTNTTSPSTTRSMLLVIASRLCGWYRYCGIPAVVLLLSCRCSDGAPVV